jgi:transcriptional regulator NrdR family protein
LSFGLELTTAHYLPVISREDHLMSFDRNDIKRGIDKTANRLKSATDRLANKSQETEESMKEKAKELARKTGDQMIEKGTRLRNAAR